MKNFLEPYPRFVLYRGTNKKWLGDEIGRLARLKILWGQPRAGSIPARATNCSRILSISKLEIKPKKASCRGVYLNCRQNYFTVTVAVKTIVVASL